MKKCRVCKTEIDNDVIVCPNCKGVMKLVILMFGPEMFLSGGGGSACPKKKCN